MLSATDRIVAEVNYGGQMVEATIRAIDANAAFNSVTTSRNKVMRAEPIAAMYAQGRCHHLGSLPELEDQMCSFTTAFDRRTAGYSPSRVDALVLACTELTEPMADFGVFEIYRRKAQGLPLVGTPHPMERMPALMVPRVVVDNRTEWRRLYDEMISRPTPDHPDCAGGEIEHVNGPLCRPTYAVGSLEWQQQQKEGAR